MSEQLEQALNILAERFGSTGAQLWEQLVRYEVAQAYFAAVAPLVVTLVAGLVVLWDVKEERYGEVGFIAFVVLVVGAFTWVASLSYAIPALMAPEAAVIRGLLP